MGTLATQLTSASSTVAPTGDADGPVPGRDVDVAIVGAGLAGSVLALVLARRGLSVVVVDPRVSYPADFRCEKLVAEQVSLLERLGVVDALDSLPPLEGPPCGVTRRGFRYGDFVNAVRNLWPETVQFIEDRACDVSEGADQQRLELASGQSIAAKLVVLATGVGGHLAKRLGIQREVLRDRHSVCVGFSIRPRGDRLFPFHSLERQGRSAGDGVGFVSLFPWAGSMRVNLFLYHDPRSDEVRAFRVDPVRELLRLFPNLGEVLGEVELVHPAEVRSTDLYQACGGVAGAVLIGDAAASSCPATGMGVTRLLTDISQLVEAYLPTWLSGPRIGPDQIRQFEIDLVRSNMAREAVRRAEAARSIATSTSLAWRLRRVLGRVRQRAAALGFGPHFERPSGARRGLRLN